jgi:hypothetical protein
MLGIEDMMTQGDPGRNKVIAYQEVSSSIIRY